MKKQITSIVVGCGIVVVLIVLLILVSSMPSKNDKKETSSSNSSVSILSTVPENISNIEIKNASGEYNIKIENQDDTVVYSVDSLDESQSLSKDKIDSTINVLSKLGATEVVEENSEDVSKFGLDSPRASVRLTFTDQTEKTLYLGDDAPFNAGTYLKLDDENKIYLITTQSSRVFLNSCNSYVDMSTSSVEASGDDSDVTE